MFELINFSQLDHNLLIEYKTAVAQAFPPIVQQSNHAITLWPKLEQYFGEHQIFAVNSNREIIGFANTIPFFWDQTLQNLPNEGWDWMLAKGIEDYENDVKANCIGGLQIIIPTKYQGKGYSKLILDAFKALQTQYGYKNLVIPIRPTWKHKFPTMEMEDYIALKEDGKIYDPWIRTHLKQGAKIISICNRSMYVHGDLNKWNALVEDKITESGDYKVKGALNLVRINVEKNIGEYFEDNIWIYYP